MRSVAPIKYDPAIHTPIMQIPAPLLCYWIGQTESSQSARPDTLEQVYVSYG